ncbi:ribosomal-protein-alanine N-acetyltransferase [candidate division TA06 bacterium B3_TA06]|uniref:Ribosomal-protein-alanine N-acetyltransferase n=1 Tax=candidate division TA06 bacterium B3_TA06 TaxID=2012487 RepID=A0A532VB62_UNCT6|nr:MAG: ribosomal-protein-alanine N-acetyltransferase [candidate division TA06 bacterium B3_TA06]
MPATHLILNPSTCECPMQRSLNLRAMQALDLERVCEIENVSFKAPWSKGMIKELCGLENAVCLVLDVDDVIQGYASARVESDEIPILHIVNLAVAPEARRQGKGRMLLRAILERGLDAGCEWAYLEVRTTNLAAIRLYQKAGFKIFRKRSHYYEDGFDAYEMGAVIEESFKSLGRQECP